jgi:ATP adenylyltransferase/5',5'''-P-1,P-4-tetraphosphate phosphorylase II
MSWDTVLLPEDDRRAPLARRIEALFAQQRATWPALAEGEATLASLRTRVLEEGGARVVVQANPGRRRSTHAKVDAQSIAQRACFLCPQNMPAAERGIAVGDLVVLPNPFPILPRHVTIPDRQHLPQRLTGRVGELLELAAAMGPEFVVFYNGPRCGASAPDHFHFQACAAARLPALDEWPDARGHERRGHAAFGRSMLLVAGPEAAAVEADLARALDALAQDAPADDEPMVNLVATHRGGRVMAALFPRAAHRPSCYFADGEARLAISPAALEMAGMLVVAEPEQLDRVDAAAARRIYEEVSLPAAEFARLVDALGW